MPGMMSAVLTAWEFYVWYCDGSCGWHLISTDYSSPYSVNWDWSGLTEQHVYLTIHVIDKTGKVTMTGGYVENGATGSDNSNG